MNDRLNTIVDLKKYPIHDLNSPIIKNLVKKCKEEWCRVNTGEFKGWVKKESLWGLL